MRTCNKMDAFYFQCSPQVVSCAYQRVSEISFSHIHGQYQKLGYLMGSELAVVTCEPQTMVYPSGVLRPYLR